MGTETLHIHNTVHFRRTHLS